MSETLSLKSTWAYVALIALLVLSAPAAASAQGLTAVTGKVTDATGAVIPGVEVTVTNAGTGAARTVITNDAGIYLASQLQPGTYNIKAELSGFKTQQVSGVALAVDQTVTLNLPLEVGQVTDVVDVVANADVVNTVDAKLGVGFNERQIDDLPLNARNIVGLLALQAGVTTSESVKQANGEDRDDGGQVNGARNDQQNIVLDGVNINAQERGSSLEGALPTTLDSVQEFIVQTAGSGGTGGRGSGAQIQLVTKSGTNTWRGTAYEYYRTTGTSARNYFAREPLQLIRHLPGGSLGGALIKDKLFIFGAYERQTDRSATLKEITIPTPEFLNGIVRYERRDGTFGVITDGPGGMLESITQLPGDRFNPAILGPNGSLQVFRPFSTDTSRTRPGTDNGANVLRYNFNAPFTRNRNIYVSRLDFTLNQQNTFYFRGTMNDDVRTLEGESYPGAKDPRDRLDNSKGFAGNWNWVISPTLNSNFTAGLTRESLENTGLNSAYYNVPLFSEPFQTTGALRQAINTWNFVESMSWLKGSHNIQWGANFRNIDNFFRSFNDVQAPTFSASANLTANNLSTADSPPILRGLGATEFARVRTPELVGDGLLAATGSTTGFSEDVQFGINGNPLAAGSPFVRNYRLQEYDFYIQDNWRMKPNFTLNYGINYSLQTPPYERDGVQVNWVENLGNRLRTQALTTKTSAELPLYAAQLAGRSNNAPDYYSADTNNWAPRASFAWTPTATDGLFGVLASKGGQLVVRGGYQLSYDRVGGRFARDAATTGSVGLKTRFAFSSFVRSIDGVQRERAPRVGVGGVLPRGGFPAASQAPGFVLPQGSGGAGDVTIGGIDSDLRSPDNHLVTFTLSKELPGGWVVESSYVGRFARGLVGQVDLASPVNLRDPASGQSYYDAIRALYTGPVRSGATFNQVAALPFFENAYPEAKRFAERSSGRTFVNSTQAFYWLLFGDRPGRQNAASIADFLQNIEGGLGVSKLLQSQLSFFGLFGNLSYSNYNSGQFSVRKRFSQGYQMTLNYTLSKSLDTTSAAEARGNRANGQSGEGLAEDPYNPSFSYARSDFDRRHQVNVNFLAELPFGRGKLIGGNASGVAQQIIGGWQVSGITSASSGRPFNFTSGLFNHHFFGRSIPHVSAPLPFDVQKQNGRVYLLAGTDSSRQALGTTSFVDTYPGGPIARNQGRGPSFWNVDLSLQKKFNLTETTEATFRWETFNAFNHPNFAIPADAQLRIARANTAEVTTTVSPERVMQFSFRIAF